MPFEKHVISTNEAMEFFHKHRMYDKERLFKFRRSSRVNVYRLNKFEDYFYGYMVPNTGYLKYFELHAYDEGFVLQMPVKEEPRRVPKFCRQEKVFSVLKESSKWGELLEIGAVGALNENISKGKIGEIMLVQEALQEQKIAEIAKQLANRPDVKFIMIAGPSSSGKTTFSPLTVRTAPGMWTARIRLPWIITLSTGKIIRRMKMVIMTLKHCRQSILISLTRIWEDF